MKLIKTDSKNLRTIKEALTYLFPIFLVPSQEQADYLNGLSLLGYYNKVDPLVRVVPKGEQFTLTTYSSVFVPEGCDYHVSNAGWVVEFRESAYR